MLNGYDVNYVRDRYIILRVAIPKMNPSKRGKII